MREIASEAALQPFPDPYVEGFAFDEEGQIVYPGMQVQVRLPLVTTPSGPSGLHLQVGQSRPPRSTLPTATVAALCPCRRSEPSTVPRAAADFGSQGILLAGYGFVCVESLHTADRDLCSMHVRHPVQISRHIRQ